jgi:hypothetical protein
MYVLAWCLVLGACALLPLRDERMDHVGDRRSKEGIRKKKEELSITANSEQRTATLSHISFLHQT